MRLRTIGLALAAAAVMVLGLASTGLALHDGGVAHCDACHTMHNSLEGASVIEGGTIGTAGDFLLKGATQSEACLNCHEGDAGSYHISTAGALAPNTALPVQMSPGGDFGWLKVTYTWTGHEGEETEHGDRHGHNVVAPAFGYNADSTLTVAPGGTYSANSLHCSSCHDPHGKYRIFADGSEGTSGLPIADRGSYPPGTNIYRSPSDGQWAVGAYRLLAGTGYNPASIDNSTLAFAHGVPAAMVPSSYNRSDNTTQTRVAYGSGMSEWCANCHGDIHNDSVSTNLRHPASNLADLGTIANNYNAYVSSGTVGNIADNSFLSLVPFETGDGNDQTGRTNMAGLAKSDDSVLTGPSTTSNVMCLSCHRAHASGFPSMLRWNNSETFITEQAAYAEDMGRLTTDWTAAYYGRAATKFGNFQRSLCNKCHMKD